MKRDLPKDRPPPLKINRPADLPPLHHLQPAHPVGQPPPYRPGNPNYRQPVIIHTYSPEVIQTDSDNFRQLVQRLTGPASHTSPLAPPPKRARAGLPPPATGTLHPNYHSHAHSSISNQAHPVPQPPPAPLVPSPRGFLPHRPAYGEPPVAGGHSNLPHNPLLSPSLFDFSPSVLPSPSMFAFDFPSPLGLATATGSNAGLSSPIMAPGSSAAPGPHSFMAGFPSPGPLSLGFLTDLPVLSPAALSWIERNAETAEAIIHSRPLISAGLPPRPPTTTANLFPSPLQSAAEDEKPTHGLHRGKR